MYYKPLSFLFLLPFLCRAQETPLDTIYLMNGHIVNEKVLDTAGNTVTIRHPRKQGKTIIYDWEQLYLVSYVDGAKRYYYQKDSTINNWFTREEMWLYMKGESDARKGFKARGSLIGAGMIGLLGGLTGTFWAPVAPYSFMAFSGLPRVRIRHRTVSNINYLKCDAYILGYERVARQKRKLRSLIGGTIGLAAGYCLYAALHSYYPETVNFGFNK